MVYSGPHHQPEGGTLAAKATKTKRNAMKRIERRQEVVRLKLEEGLSYREIGPRVGVSYRTAHRDFVAVMKELTEREYEVTSALRMEAVARLERLFRITAPSLKSENAKERLAGVAAVLKIQDQINRLLGLEAPQKVEHLGTSEIVVDFRDRFDSIRAEEGNPA